MIVALNLQTPVVHALETVAKKRMSTAALLVRIIAAVFPCHSKRRLWCRTTVSYLGLSPMTIRRHLPDRDWNLPPLDPDKLLLQVRICRTNQLESV